MNTPTYHRLYQLLPAIYRQRAIYRDTDPDPGELEHLVEILESTLDVLETDISDLYENWFIETCDDWVVPYIGDLLGVSDIGTRNNTFNQSGQGRLYGLQESRAYVANTLAYRRRKGTAPVIEQLVRDVTGWRARVVEFFEHLAITQNLDHRRSENTTVNLRISNQLQLLGSPFEQQVAYSTRLRQDASDQSKYNVSSIGLFLWRLQSYPVSKGTAQAIEISDECFQGRCYTFSPLLDSPTLPLFNVPQLETDITHLATEINLPGQLRTDPHYPGYQGETPPPFQIFMNGQPYPIPPQEVLITRLHVPEKPETWEFPDLPKQVLVNPSTPQATKVVAVDPEMGRILFLDKTPPKRVEVNYAYGFSADIGGGPYNRSDAIAQIPAETLPQPNDPFFPPLYWEIEQRRSGSVNPLADAVRTWNGTVTAWQACEEHIFIPLARIEIPKQSIRLAPLPVEQLSSYQFGIINGLEVAAEIGQKEIIIAPGLAIDYRGRPIWLDHNASIPLEQHIPRLPAEQPLLVILSYQAGCSGSNCQLHVIPLTQTEQYPENTYIRLTRVTLDIEGKLKTITNAAPHRTSSFQAGVVEGLTVITLPDVLEAIVQPGIAVDKSGQMMILDQNIPLDLRKYQGQCVWLAISYADIRAASNWQLHILTEQDAQDQTRYPGDRYIRLAKLIVPTVQIAKREMSPSSRPRFVAGVVRGLRVKGKVGDRTVKISVGLAIDGTGRPIVLEQDFQFKGFGLHRGQTATLVIAYRPSALPPQWELKLLRDENNPKFPKEQYLRLAKLKIGMTGRLEAQPINLLSTFKPGVVQSGLRLETSTAPNTIQVSAGKAVNQIGQIIELPEPCTIDLSRYPGRAFTLFISPQHGQGWKAIEAQDVETNDISKSWRHLGLVPEAPYANTPFDNKQHPDQSSSDLRSFQTGVIVIKDNHTYVGNLDIVIPSSKYRHLKFQILAASGYRPHLRGDVTVRGFREVNSQRSREFESGDCLLNGLLIEGKLTVQPGELRYLTLQHCTFIPKPTWGITVEAGKPFPALETLAEQDDNNSKTRKDEESGDFLFILFSIFWLIPQLLKIGFNSPNLPPHQRLHKLTQYMLTEFEKVWCALREELYQCQQSDADSPSSDAEWICNWLCSETEQDNFRGDNADLNITIDHSIVGPITLTNSVPHLTVLDSIIDWGSLSAKVDENNIFQAISAPGTNVNLQRSTIFGTTYVRSLEASNSLFTNAVLVIDQQLGCTRFCYVPAGSQTSLRYRCQPDLALQELSTFPAAITAFTFNPVSHRPFLGTAGEGILQLTVQSPESEEDWTATAIKDQFITALTRYRCSDRPEDEGKIIFFAGASGNKFFRLSEDRPDWQPIELGVINTDITTLITYTQFLTGTISSEGTKVTGTDTKFTTELHLGDKITVSRQHQEETRTVVTIESAESLTIDQAFSADLPSETSFKVSLLLAGTAGNGVWQFTASGDRWTLQGLKACSITSLAINSKHRIYAGTNGGVFRWSVRRQSWQAFNQGLTDQQITTLVIDSRDRIFAGTATGLIFRSVDQGKHWTLVSKGLSRSKVTSLAVQNITGRGIVRDNTLIVSEQIARQLQCGSTVTIGDRTRIIVNDPQDQAQAGTLVLNAEFCPSLANQEVSFTSHYLFAGTTSNGIFRSHNNGNSWEPITVSTQHQQIVVIAVDIEQNTIWAGTAIGSVFRSQDYGNHWESVNKGLKDVDKVFSILLRIKPQLTSTTYGQPAYAQLKQVCPLEIREGAEDGAEIGVFNQLSNSKREHDLQTILDEYLRFGLKAGIFYMT